MESRAQVILDRRAQHKQVPEDMARVADYCFKNGESACTTIYPTVPLKGIIYSFLHCVYKFGYQTSLLVLI